MSNKKRILLVEDDPNFGIILRDFLKIAQVLRKFGPQLTKLLEDFIRQYKFDDRN